MKLRFNMTSKTGLYIEELEKDKLIQLRATDPRFKYARINSALQAYPHLVRLGVIYPEWVTGLEGFTHYNYQLDQEAAA
jgi:hypothetical protein